jgi:type VI secretion system secreted protein VgrG
MEVVVVFEGGDPDKPMVLGAMYNGTHPPPFALPGDRTRSGIRTQTSPGGGGSNELSFEDQAGSEQIYVHAQRDLDEVVERNHTLLNRGDERLRVIGSRMDIVEEDVIARVGRNAEEHVAGDRTMQVEGNRIDVVTGNSDERVSGMLVTRIEGKERRSVLKSADLEYADDLTTRVRGCLTTLVGKDDAKRSWVTHAEGTAKLTSSVATEVGSEKELVLRVGKSSIRITSEKIEIESPAVTVKGAGGGLSADDDGLKLGSKKDAQLLVEKKLVLKSKEGGSLSMEKEVKVDGQQILLNSPEQANDPPPKDPDPPTKVVFKDQDGKPLAYQRYLVKMDDGSEVSGMTDKDGKAEADLKSGGKVTFPDLSKARAG